MCCHQAPVDAAYGSCSLCSTLIYILLYTVCNLSIAVRAVLSRRDHWKRRMYTRCRHRSRMPGTYRRTIVCRLQPRLVACVETSSIQVLGALLSPVRGSWAATGESREALWACLSSARAEMSPCLGSPEHRRETRAFRISLINSACLAVVSSPSAEHCQYRPLPRCLIRCRFHVSDLTGLPRWHVNLLSRVSPRQPWGRI